jgi:hypothetical protein
MHVVVVISLERSFPRDAPRRPASHDVILISAVCFSRFIARATACTQRPNMHATDIDNIYFLFRHDGEIRDDKLQRIYDGYGIRVIFRVYYC